MKKAQNQQPTIIREFIREKRLFIAWLLLIFTVFYILALLYGYENAAVNMAYGFVILLFILICCLGIDLLKYKKKYMDLMEAGEKCGDSNSYLPQPQSLQEVFYQEMIRQIQEEKRKLVTSLDEKKQDMDDYYTMWTHQIKTPIAALRLLLEREREEGAGSQTEKELFKIEQYIEMALYYARLDSISSDMLFARNDICGLVKTAVKKYAPLLIGSGLSFSMEDFELKAVTDEKWFVFAVEQVISNAVKYTVSGGIRIYGINADKEECKQHVKAVVIQDTGIGIRESDLPRIFERGFTGYNGRMDKKSTGLGLYLCRQILCRLSHTIEVRSVQGEGTKVIILFHVEEM